MTVLCTVIEIYEMHGIWAVEFGIPLLASCQISLLSHKVTPEKLIHKSEQILVSMDDATNMNKYIVTVRRE